MDYACPFVDEVSHAPSKPWQRYKKSCDSVQFLPVINHIYAVFIAQAHVLLKKMAGSIGINKMLGFHVSRHTFATSAIKYRHITHSQEGFHDEIMHSFSRFAL